jgi:protein-S-isoprenylcysteine O-methyltransferase Ste14
MAETRPKTKIHPSLKAFRNLLGVGLYLLLIGLLLEALIIVVRQWVSFPISLVIEAQLVMTIICVLVCLLGMIWFNYASNLVGVHLAGGENKLITNGPFNYVRHPLYATLLITLPPLLIIWYSDLIFIIPWVIMFVVAQYVVLLEERGLVRVFGEEYLRYKQYVPALLPYKGAGGERYRASVEPITSGDSGGEST